AGQGVVTVVGGGALEEGGTSCLIGQVRDGAAPALATIDAPQGRVDGRVGLRDHAELGGGLDLQAVLQHGVVAEAGGGLAADVLGVVGGAQAEHVGRRGRQAQRLLVGG